MCPRSIYCCTHTSRYVLIVLPSPTHEGRVMTTLTKNKDKLEHNEVEHDKLSLHGTNLTSKEKPKEKLKWWECGDHVRGKKSRETDGDAAGERGRALTSGASGQDKKISSLPSAGRSFHSAVPFGHRPGLMSEFGGVAGWLSKPRQGATARVADAEVLLGLASQNEAPEAPKQAPKLSRNPTLMLTNPNANPNP